MPAPKRPYRMSDISALLVPRIQEAQQYIAQREQEAQAAQTPTLPNYFALRDIAQQNPVQAEPQDSGVSGLAEYLWKSWAQGGLTGSLEELTMGHKLQEPSTYDPNAVEEFVGGLLGFVSPADIVAFAAGGGIGGAIAKEVGAKAIAEAALSSAGGFAAQSGAREAAESKLRTGSVDFPATIAAAAKGGVIGGAAGAAGGAVRALSNLKPVAKELLASGAEAGAFGTASPVVEEGRAPNMDDYLNAGYAIAAFKVAGLAGKKAKGLFDIAAKKETAKVQEAVDKGSSYEDAVADRLYSALESKHDPAVLMKLASAKDGEQVGTFGDFLTDKAHREQFSGQLDIPVVVDNSNERVGGLADFNSRTIRIGNSFGDSKAVLLKNVIEEAQHFKDKASGESFVPKYDPNTISEEDYRNLPEEKRVAGAIEQMSQPKPKVESVKAETLNKAEKKALKIQGLKEVKAKVAVSNPLPKSLAAAIETKAPSLEKTYTVTAATDKTSLVGLLDKAAKEGGKVKPSAEFRMTEQFKQLGREGWVRYEKGQPYFVNPVKDVSAVKHRNADKYIRTQQAISDGTYAESNVSRSDVSPVGNQGDPATGDSYIVRPPKPFKDTPRRLKVKEVVYQDGEVWKVGFDYGGKRIYVKPGELERPAAFTAAADYREKLKAIPPEKRKATLIAAREFDHLALEHQNLFDVERYRNEFNNAIQQSGAGDRGMGIAQSKVKGRIREQFLEDIGKQADLSDPAQRAELLPKLKERIAELQAKKEAGEPLRAGGTDFMPFSLRFGLTKAMKLSNMKEDAPSVYEQIRQKLRDFAPDVAKQAQNRVESKAGRDVLSDIISADNVGARLAGTWLNEGVEAGLNGKKDLAWGQAMSKQMEGKAPMSAEAHAFRRIFNEAIDQARKPLSEGGAGMNIGKLPNYLPGFFKEDVLYSMADDLATFEKEMADSKTFNDEVMIDHLKKKSSYLQDMVKAFVKGGASYETALRKANQLVHSQLYQKASFEKTRGGLELLPSQLWEDDFRKIFPAYVNSMAERMAQTMFFGQKGEKIVEALDKIRREAPDEVPIVEEIYRQFTGAVNSDPTRKFKTKAAQKIADFYTDYQGIVKVSLGTATFANLWQPLISTIADLGAWKMVSGAARLFDPAVRSGIRNSGALKPDIIDAMLGARNKSMLTAFGDKAAKWSGFRPINKLWQYLAASTAEVAVNDWHKLAQGTGKRADWAKLRLADFGIDHTKPLERNQVLEAMYRFAVDSQLQKNVLKDPLAFNDPKLRPLFLFKRFGYRQFAYMKDMLIREGERGNYFPAVRLAIGGALGGTAAIAGFNILRQLMSGQTYYYRKPDNALEDIYNKIATIGAFGVMSDITRLDQQITAADRLKFAAVPVFWSDIEKAVEAYNAVSRDWERYGDAWLVTKRNVHNAFNIIGGNVAQASKRLLTDEQRRRGLSRLKGKEKRDIYLAILAGNGRLAADKIADWNRSNRNDAITVQDVNIGEVSKFMKRELDSKLQAAGLSKEGPTAPEYRQKYLERRKVDMSRLSELRGTINQAGEATR